jgi:hypothetical protein
MLLTSAPACEALFFAATGLVPKFQPQPQRGVVECRLHTGKANYLKAPNVFDVRAFSNSLFPPLQPRVSRSLRAQCVQMSSSFFERPSTSRSILRTVGENQPFAKAAHHIRLLRARSDCRAFTLAEHTKSFGRAVVPDFQSLDCQPGPVDP